MCVCVCAGLLAWATCVLLHILLFLFTAPATMWYARGNWPFTFCARIICSFSTLATTFHFRLKLNSSSFCCCWSIRWFFFHPPFWELDRHFQWRCWLPDTSAAYLVRSFYLFLCCNGVFMVFMFVFRKATRSVSPLPPLCSIRRWSPYSWSLAHFQFPNGDAT